jgi:hypothetical protein
LVITFLKNSKYTPYGARASFLANMLQEMKVKPDVQEMRRKEKKGNLNGELLRRHEKDSVNLGRY